jgi:hypothetical protein
VAAVRPAVAHAVCNRHDRDHARVPWLEQHGGAKIFVNLFAPCQRRETDIYFKCYAPRVRNIGARNQTCVGFNRLKTPSFGAIRTGGSPIQSIRSLQT